MAPIAIIDPGIAYPKEERFLKNMFNCDFLILEEYDINNEKIIIKKQVTNAKKTVLAAFIKVIKNKLLSHDLKDQRIKTITKKG